ncbi:MAG: hypothetical protein K9J06_07300 [Flavobacteriales bacterium]|nr:hypothetical protein [Flavobacteriales bacterium]
MEKDWHYLSNQLLNETEGSYKKAFQLSSYHHSVLQGRMTADPSDPDWAMLCDRYSPFHAAYSQHYAQWSTASGLQQGRTVDIKQMMGLLNAALDTWDANIRSVAGYAKGSPGHQMLFPNARKPFHHGDRVSRIAAVETLAKALADHPALTTVHATVDAFATQLATALASQMGARGHTRSKSLEVEQARRAVMTEQYRNLGFLIDKLASTPKAIAPFFDLNVLRQSDQVRYTGTLSPGETEAVLTHTFMADDGLRIRVRSEDGAPAGTPVRFHLATTPSGTDSTPVEVMADAAAAVISVSRFGISDHAAHRHLTAVNANGIELHYVVQLL